MNEVELAQKMIIDFFEGTLKNDFTLDSYDYGITSNLPSVTYGTGEIPNSLKESPDNLSRAIFLKNTESPYFYFYSVLRNRYADSGTSGSFILTFFAGCVISIVFNFSGIGLIASIISLSF